MCGHVGNNKYVPIPFYLVANNKKCASDIARKKPRVKRHNKNVIRYIREISESEYWIGRIINELNPYLACKSKREQLVRCPSIQDEVLNIERREYKKPTHYRKYAINKAKADEWKLFRNEWRNRYAKI